MISTVTTEKDLGIFALSSFWVCFKPIMRKQHVINIRCAWHSLGSQVHVNNFSSLLDHCSEKIYIC